MKYPFSYFRDLAKLIRSDPLVTHIFIGSVVLGIFTHWWIGVTVFFFTYAILGTIAQTGANLALALDRTGRRMLERALTASAQIITNILERIESWSGS